MSKNKLKDKRIAFLVTDGFEQVELTEPWQSLKEEGAQLEIVSPNSKSVQGMNHFEKGKEFNVDQQVTTAAPSHYDGLVLPGGLANPDSLRQNEDAVRFTQKFFEQKKPVGAICHGPWMLVEADVLKGRNVTSWPSLKTDIRNAGGNWQDKEVIVDQGLVTSRNPDDLPAFCSKLVEEFCEGKHEQQARSA